MCSFVCTLLHIMLCVIMVALWNRADHYIFCPLVSSFFPRLISVVGDWIHTWCGFSENLGCRSETCCMRLAGNAGAKKLPKMRHLGTIAQVYRAIPSQLRHVSTIGKKLVKQQYVLQMSPQYGVLRPTSGWDRFTNFGHPCKFQRVSRLGSVTAWQSSSERQPNFAAFNRGRHLCSAGRPSGWALAHILVVSIIPATYHR